ncbi:winged helix-turn-helix domain-containing protein [Amycolatopsis roodepoortensis]
MRHKDLLHAVRGPALYLAQLRHKLEADPTQPRHLITAQGMGYRFDP